MHRKAKASKKPRPTGSNLQYAQSDAADVLGFLAGASSWPPAVMSVEERTAFHRRVALRLASPLITSVSSVPRFGKSVEISHSGLTGKKWGEREKEEEAGKEVV